MSTDSLTLTCGPWTASLSPDGVLSDIRVHGTPVLHALMFVVRDDAWGTVPGTVDVALERADRNGFAARINGRSAGSGVELDWSVELTGSNETVRVAVSGRAAREFRSNRVGFVALHPLSWAGQDVEVFHTGGVLERSRYPEEVSPHQPFRDVTGLRQTVPSGRVSIDFDGDLFETEDQRNWSDASYKTYSRPLELPFPVLWREGEPFEQVVTLTFESAGQAEIRTPIERFSAAVSIEVMARSVPVRLGVAVGPDDDVPALGALLAELRPRHLRVDLEVSESGIRGVETLLAVQGTGVPIELALHLGADPVAALEELTDALSSAPPLDALLVFDALAPSTTRRAVDAVRAAMAGITPPRSLIVGTDDNLAELNRNRLSVEDLGADAVTFCLNPGVHDLRDSAMLETPDAVPAMVRTAGTFARGAVALGPLTLRPRRNLYRSGVIDRRGRDEAAADPRQRGMLAAAWLVATIEAASRAGVSRFTAFELSGPRGLTDGDLRFPVFDVVRAICAATAVRCTRTSDPAVAALTVEIGRILRIFTVNRMARAVEVLVPGAERAVDIAPYSVKAIDVDPRTLERTA